MTSWFMYEPHSSPGSGKPGDFPFTTLFNFGTRYPIGEALFHSSRLSSLLVIGSGISRGRFLSFPSLTLLYFKIMTLPVKLYVTFYQCSKCGTSSILMLKGQDRPYYCPYCGELNTQRFITNSMSILRVTDLNMIKDLIPTDFYINDIPED